MASEVVLKIPPVMLLGFIIGNYYLYFPGYFSLNPMCVSVYPVTVIILIVLLAFFRLLTTDSGTVPSYFDFLPETSITRLNSRDFCSNISPAFVTNCDKCMKNRPARAHHCSICKRCVLKRDHHCVWISNCVGLKNQRYFCQLLTYGAIETCIIACACGSLIGKDYENVGSWTVAGCGVNFATCLSLTLMAGYNLWLVLTNRTMYELKHHASENIFDLGLDENLSSLVGLRLLCWLLPVNFEPELISYGFSAEAVDGSRVVLKNAIVYPSNYP